MGNCCVNYHVPFGGKSKINKDKHKKKINPVVVLYERKGNSLGEEPC